MDNKRNFLRVDFETRGELLYAGKTIQAKVKNLSLKGAFFETTEKAPINAEVSLKIFLLGCSSDLSVSAKGKVARADNDGFGVNITEINIDSFIHLKNIIQYNSGAPDQTIKEFQDYVKHTLENNDER